MYPFSQSLSFGWGIRPIYVKVITDKYDPVAIYFIVLGSNLYTIFVFKVLGTKDNSGTSSLLDTESIVSDSYLFFGCKWIYPYTNQ